MEEVKVEMEVENNMDNYWKRRYVQDIVHNQMELPQFYWQFIDTPEFKRLHDIKQLGSLYYVFPGAVHTRFSHSLGVAYIARQQMKHFRDIALEDQKHRGSLATFQQAALDIEDRDIFNVGLAGLMHDLGHGIYSHLFDRDFMPLILEKYNIKWEHEDASVMMLEHLVDQNNIDVDREDLKFVTRLIKGDLPSQFNEKRWMFDIVANKTNSLDVDKFDYLMRDSKHLGIKTVGFDFNRLIMNSRVINQQICYNQKIYYDLNQVFHTRYKLFKDTYTHRVCKAIDYMIVDALLEANNVFKFQEKVFNAEAYTNVTDPLLGFIEVSKNPELKKSQEILKRLRRRDIYRFIDQKLLINKEILRNITPQEIANFQDSGKSGPDLKAEDIIVSYHSLNWGKGADNPIESVMFYKSENNLSTFYKTKQEVGLCFPKNYQEHYLRIFVKDDEKFEAAKEAFQRLSKKYKTELGDINESPDRGVNYSQNRRLSQEQQVISQNTLLSKRESQFTVEELEEYSRREEQEQEKSSVKKRIKF